MKRISPIESFIVIRTILIFFITISFKWSYCQSLDVTLSWQTIIHRETNTSKYSIPVSVKRNSHYQRKMTIVNESIYPLTVHADFVIAYGYIYNRETGQDTLIIVNDTTFTILLPVGRYGIISGYFPNFNTMALFSKDSINLVGPTEIQFVNSQAIHHAKFRFVRETGDSLHVSTLTFYFYSRISENGLRIINFDVSKNPYTLRYDQIPQGFDTEWTVKGKQGVNHGNLYLISGELVNSISDTLISNYPANLVGADFYYHFPDSIEKAGNIQVMTLFPDFNFWGGGDTIYHHPVHFKVFMDTSVSFFLRSSTFKQSVHAANLIPWSILWTPELRFDQQKVWGYFHFDRKSIAFVVSETKNKVHIGLTPTYWFGKFFNRADTIKIRSPYGKYIHLFLSQSNDILRHTNISYKLYHNNSLIKQGHFPPWSPAPLIFLGFNPDSLTLPVSPGSYKINIIDNHYQLAGEPGISRAIAGFDLTKPDKNPPNLISFQILAQKELRNIISSHTRNIVRFIVEEETTIGNIELSYAVFGDSIWTPIPLTHQTPYWQGELPPLANGRYSLRLTASDVFQNYIDCLMAPAFIVDNSTGIGETTTVPDDHISKKVSLFPAYPNPFNASITVSYFISPNFVDGISIAIYNLLGQKIKTLFEGKSTPGVHRIRWNGVNQLGQPVQSGLYFIVMRGGDTLLQQKILLIR